MLSKLFSCCLLVTLLMSCQSTPEVVEEKQKPVEEFKPIVVERPKPPKTKPEVKPQPPKPPMRPDTISLCPSGVNGLRQSSFTNNGRYCYSREKAQGCFKNTDELVLEKSKKHCQDVFNKRQAMGVGSGVPAEVSHIKSDSCSCGWNKGKEVCKSYLRVICREVSHSASN